MSKKLVLTMIACSFLFMASIPGYSFYSNSVEPYVQVGGS